MASVDEKVRALREKCGRRVRAVWVAWAREQPDPAALWLVGWGDLEERFREVDRKIGMALWTDGFEAGNEAGLRQALRVIDSVRVVDDDGVLNH